MKMLRTLFIAQLVCVLLLLAIVLSALVTTEQQHVTESYDRQKIALTQLVKNFVGDDYKMLVQQIRASSNPQMLQLSKIDGTVLHEHNNASSRSAMLDFIFQMAGINQQAVTLKNDEHQLQLKFIPDFDRSNAVFLQAF